MSSATSDLTRQGAGGLRPEDEQIRENIEQCSVPDQWISYFDQAERDMDRQWAEVIWPKVMGANFTRVLEIAPGGGRNTAKLLGYARELHIVDLNDYALQRCRDRFASYDGLCTLNYHRNDGRSLPMIPDASITFIYSWDSFVHFDRCVIEHYVHEFARVMAPGATGFLHHSNYGTVSDSTEFKNNPHWRSNMTADLFRSDCERAGLQIRDQTLIDWGPFEQLDCISLFAKP